MPEAPKTSMRMPVSRLQALAVASIAAVMFAWLATLGTGCGPGLGAVRITATASSSTTPSGTPTPGKLSGDVLIAGGLDAVGSPVGQAEIYDPTTGMFSTTGTMKTARAFHTVTELPSGTILLTGGQTNPNGNTPLNTAELYNESTEVFKLTTGKMVAARTLQTATLLQSGQVLITGGADASGNPLNTAELYNPSTQTFTATKGNMNFPRAAHTATLLGSGQVLIAGGYSNSSQSTVQNTGELYDPTTQTFTTITPLMRDNRYFDQAQIFGSGTLNGQVLLAGGHDTTGVTTTTELYDPSGNTFNTSGIMTISRMQFASAIVQLSGINEVLLCGGMTNASTVTQTAELFNSASSTSAQTGNMTDSRRFHTATLLTSAAVAGEVLVTGGQDAVGVPNTVSSAELYDPTAGTFAPTTAPMANARYGQTAIVLS